MKKCLILIKCKLNEIRVKQLIINIFIEGTIGAII
jgi:hypothetical protein